MHLSKIFRPQRNHASRRRFLERRNSLRVSNTVRLTCVFIVLFFSIPKFLNETKLYGTQKAMVISKLLLFYFVFSFPLRRFQDPTCRRCFKNYHLNYFSYTLVPENEPSCWSQKNDRREFTRSLAKHFVSNKLREVGKDSSRRFIPLLRFPNVPHFKHFRSNTSNL